MKIYTKTGDAGTTGLQGGNRISKSSSRIITYGSIDEINSILGIVLSQKVDDDLKQLFTKLQNDLFIIGSDLSKPDLPDSVNRATPEMVEFLENMIDKYENQLDPLSNFILPGGSYLAALIHLSRTVTRRAETQLIKLSDEVEINKICKIYLNRLSDLFFVLSRIINKRNNIPDIIWNLKRHT